VKLFCLTVRQEELATALGLRSARTVVREEVLKITKRILKELLRASDSVDQRAEMQFVQSLVYFILFFPYA
jgi:hypothetical protein